MPNNENPPIEIESKSIIKLLGSDRVEYFHIPEFQRSYTWDKKNVEELLEDLLDSYEDFIRQEESRKVQYFLGNIISHYNESEQFSGVLRESLLIDGQQRLTTLSFLIGELYKHGKKLVKYLYDNGVASEDIILEKLRNCIIKDEDVNTSMGIIKSTDEVVNVYLNKYFNSITQTISNLPEENDSNKTLAVSRRTIEEKIKKYFQFTETQNVDTVSNVYIDLKNFSKFLLENIIISHVSTTSFADAFIIFERQNNRGEELSFADIVKHYLMEPISKNREEFNTRAKDLNIRWLDVKKQIDEDGFSFNRFIIYFFRAEYEYLFSTDGKKALKELKKHKEENTLLNYDLNNPEELLEKLEDTKDHFLKIRKGLDLNGEYCFPLLFIKRYFDFDQHYQVLMAMRTLEDNDKFTRIAINLESFIFISSFSERGSTFERAVIAFIKSIHNDNNPQKTCYSEHSCSDFQSNETCEHICSHSVACKYDTEHKIKDLTMNFIDAAESLILKHEFLQKENSNNTASDRLKYIIYRIEHQYRTMADEVEINLFDLNQFRSNNMRNYSGEERAKVKINVDHILEIGRDHFSEYEEFQSGLSEYEVTSLRYRVGNLTLLTKYENGGRFNGWSPREKLLGKKIKFCTDHIEIILTEDEDACRQNNCNKELTEKKFSFDDTPFALTKALSRNDVPGRGRQAKTYRFFKLNYPKLGRRSVWNLDEIVKREKIQFHILSQALLIKFNPHNENYDIHNQIKWPQFPPRDGSS